jgi:hypothetical protein
VGGVEEILSQHATILHRLGQHISVLVGMGEVFTESFPVRIEPVLGSQNKSITKAHERSRNGDYKPLKRLTNRIYDILTDWAQNLDVVLAHNVLHMPFNLPFTLALRRLTASSGAPVIISWAHDSPYLEPEPPEYLTGHPWSVLHHTHPAIHYVTISESRKHRFQKLYGDVLWRVIPNGIDPAGFFYLDETSRRLAEYPSEEPGALHPHHPWYQDPGL